MSIINISMLICIIYISIAVFILLILSNKISKYTISKIENKIKSSSKGVEFYENLDLKLRKNGMKFKFKEITPIKFILFNIISSLVVFLFLLIFSKDIFIGMIGAIAIVVFINRLIVMQNKYENEKMLNDLKALFSSVKTQMKAGSHLTDALGEGYLVVANRRLKAALLDLNNNLLIDKDIFITLDKFKSNFDNSYIETFCILISQASKSGQTLQMLEDLNKKIRDIENVMCLRLENKVKKRIMIYEVLIFIGLIMFILVIIAGEMQNSFSLM